MSKNILITGAAGFIGSEFLRTIKGQDKEGKKTCFSNMRINVVDKLTYAADLSRLDPVKGRYNFYKADISDKLRIENIFMKLKPSIVVNFAAESHVDRSIIDASLFMRANLIGVHVLLECCRKFSVEKLIHVSTDEVYGEIEKGSFKETDPLVPNSPYSASKAAADLLIQSYVRTYGLAAVIVRPSNNYGPWQFPEKFIPVVIYKALRNEAVPVYADGSNVREWLYVNDCVNGIIRVAERGKIGQVYNIGSGEEKKNIDVAKLILKALSKPESLIKFVKDRPGHDLRYSLDSRKIMNSLGWRPDVDFEKGLFSVIRWYKDNYPWLKKRVVNLRSYWKRVYQA
ncbi:MAG: dTDP-glucose 4,6-dehydratase [Candidatus Omnitrophota bacterium]|jgi:dTDP-glucose 4,6-dehydratase|nr:MAG: dTDP-glucose 4,6-dehydratase [Candidatus Omnitrophota bacterium]